MKKFVVLTSLTLGVFALPTSSQAATPDMLAELLASSQAYAELRTDLHNAERALLTLMRDHRSQEEEFKMRFAELEARTALLKEQRLELESYDATKVLIDRDLVSDLPLNGAPHNHLKIWNRHRQIQHAQAVQDSERVSAFAELEQNETDLKKAWEELEVWHENNRYHYRHTHRSLREQIATLKRLRSSQQSKTQHLFTVLGITPQASALQIRRMTQRQLIRLNREARVDAALRQARIDNHLTRVHPEVQAELSREQAEELRFDASLQLRDLIEALGHDKLDTEMHSESLDLHLGN